MIRILLATTAAATLGTAAMAEDAKVGIILGFSGPLEIDHPGHGCQRRAGAETGQ